MKSKFIQNLQKKLCGFSTLYGMYSFLEGVQATMESLWNGELDKDAVERVTKIGGFKSLVINPDGKKKK